MEILISIFWRVEFCPIEIDEELEGKTDIGSRRTKNFYKQN